MLLGEPALECKCLGCGAEIDPDGLTGSRELRKLSTDTELGYEREAETECEKCGSRLVRLVVRVG
jgi:DNA-directed RNA polymerase subunit RPC12/RpoP